MKTTATCKSEKYTGIKVHFFIDLCSPRENLRISVLFFSLSLFRFYSVVSLRYTKKQNKNIKIKAKYLLVYCSSYQSQYFNKYNLELQFYYIVIIFGIKFLVPTHFLQICNAAICAISLLQAKLLYAYQFNSFWLDDNDTIYIYIPTRRNNVYPFG